MKTRPAILFVFAVIAATVVIAQQGGPPASVRPVVEAKNLRLQQSTPMLPAPALTLPFSGNEIDAANAYCVRVLAFLKTAEESHRLTIDELYARLYSPTLQNYYSWWEFGQDRNAEIEALLQDYETQLSLFAEEANGTNPVGLRVLVEVSQALMPDVSSSWAATEMAFARAVSVISVANGQWTNNGPLNLMPELEIDIRDLLNENSRDALINQMEEELGFSI